MPAKNNRTEFIKTRLTPSERVQAERNAILLNLTMSDMIRLLVLEGPPTVSGLSADDRNSLNLILRYLQTPNNAPPEVLAGVLAQLSALIERL